ncbi:MAG: bifunctional phosphoribosylaminoimidazolecarboxamide formyltransferase/IMP cyclohydrolase [Haliscomenobacter sp.]|nr:bifunctional phosphoribosylaminoimidazolecarboxamide formyltransferase/IMP cyclohydrolase [Haliscomenobacter sp.]MBP9075841.1 bifunctional phosphoribosylaminoimidazolecarboxamide formyltransferase/IMP cyclohydrolase [Haliscomenobacter sp.]MBP9872482.1 bifunctional phosphoribosylaminoimidazolecarboxamide formyltransferase/IMP cyclohydrolase [Haliscomenobacter sp.]
MAAKKIQSALISVFSKEGLEPLIRELHRLGVTLYSTGGTQEFIESLGFPVISVETLTGYPSILDGRVKTLHPKVFGGLLARREEAHLKQLREYEIPEIDLVIVDLYPFEETLASTQDEKSIIEKIDVGGISLIRAAAKNFQDVAVVPSRQEYGMLLEILQEKSGYTDLADRQALAARAFQVSSHYDTAIFTYFNRVAAIPVFKQSVQESETLRYGENPHQQGVFFGRLEDLLEKIAGKALSYNNLVDIDAAIALIAEFRQDQPTFAILKHTNACGVATRPSLKEAWEAALAGDPVSAFGGVLIANAPIDEATASAVDAIFYEVLIAPDYAPEAIELLTRKKNRILLRLKTMDLPAHLFKSLLNGVIQQDTDLAMEGPDSWKVVTNEAPAKDQAADLLFALKCVKHLKSNAIALAKGGQLIGMGCGQTSRVDALKQAVDKARRYGFDVQGAALASDAFFPFADSVEIAHQAGIAAIIQPGGSVKDNDSIDYCNAHGLPMVMTGVRHFKH